MIKSSSIPYSIIRATQFFEFIKGIADIATDGDTIRLPPALIQPIAAEDVASAVCRIALGSPVNGTVEVGDRRSFVSMDSSGKLSPLARIPAKLSPTRKPAITALE